MPKALLLVAVSAVLLLLAAPAGAAPATRVDVVVALEQPGLADAVASSRVLTSAAKRQRLDLRSPASTAYLRSLASVQEAAAERIEAALPAAEVYRSYEVLLNGLAVSVPRGQVARLAAVPGVARVYPSVRYRARLDRTPAQIGAPQLWGADYSTAGQGVKIAILDDGIDQAHPFFDPRGFSAPAGFPKGNTAFTTGKVIVARAFPPRSPEWRNAALPFDPLNSVHATHVAGIAAGNTRTVAVQGRRVDGVAPMAYLGNYKILTIPTESGVGLDGNSPEIAAGIEAAVRDGMDVINLSIGEPEVEPARDLVVQAIEAATRAGVTVVAAGGNDFGDFGRGSVGSPGSAASAITVAAVTPGSGATSLAPFSSSGPTPISLRLKPDLAAPGVGVLSSVPSANGTWDSWSGTSMAAPHVAGAVALLKQRNPQWTPAQLKSALVTTGRPLAGDPVTRQGGGLATLGRAAQPLLFAQPTGLAFGLIRRNGSVSLAVELTDAGGGAGEWSVAVEQHASAGGATLAVPGAVAVPGRLSVTASARPNAAEGEFDGYLVLSRGGEQRRIPYWLRITRPALGGRPDGTLSRTGTYRGNTAGKRARVSTYRYPERPVGRITTLTGPEQVFAFTLRRQVANFGVAVLSRGRNVEIAPRIVRRGDENRQVGYTSLPVNLNPYLPDFLAPRAVSGAVLPAAGAYDIVFDTPSRQEAGPFTFRFWVDDTKPPTVRLLTPTVARNGVLRLTVADAGSGVDPQSVRARVNGLPRRVALARGRASIDLRGLPAGQHRLVLQVSDFQETRNMEQVHRILPNTTRLTATFRVR